MMTPLQPRAKMKAKTAGPRRARTYLIEAYAGNFLRCIYQGNDHGELRQRLRAHVDDYGFPAENFTVVRARSRKEAYELAQAIFDKRGV